MADLENLRPGDLHDLPNGPSDGDTPYGLGAWVPIAKDPRRYPMAAALEEVEPAEAPAERYFIISSPPLNQGQMGSCVGHCGRNLQLAEPVPYPRLQLDNTVAAKNNVTPAVELYYQAQRADSWAGGEYPGGSPVYEGTSVDGLMKAMKALGYITGDYVWASTTDQIRLWLRTKSPVAFAARWTKDMFDPDADGFVHPTGAVEGGHSYLLFGVDAQDNVYGYNNWGSWGIGGTFRTLEGTSFSAHSGVFKMNRSGFETLWQMGSGEASAPTEISPEPVPLKDWERSGWIDNQGNFRPSKSGVDPAKFWLLVDWENGRLVPRKESD